MKIVLVAQMITVVFQLFSLTMSYKRVANATNIYHVVVSMYVVLIGMRWHAIFEVHGQSINIH